MLSLKTCQRLKAAGLEQGMGDSSWYERDGKPYHAYVGDFAEHEYCLTEICSCPTLEELLEAVRIEIADSGSEDEFDLSHTKDWGWRICHIRGVYDESNADPCEAVAALWLKLKGMEV